MYPPNTAREEAVELFEGTVTDLASLETTLFWIQMMIFPSVVLAILGLIGLTFTPYSGIISGIGFIGIGIAIFFYFRRRGRVHDLQMRVEDLRSRLLQDPRRELGAGVEDCPQPWELGAGVAYVPLAGGDE
jgi:hypothetical protein